MEPSSSSSNSLSSFKENRNKISTNYPIGENSRQLKGDELLDDNNQLLLNGDELIRYETNATAARTLSRRLAGTDTLIEEANKTNAPLPPMGGGRNYPPKLPSRDPYIVSYDGPSDPLHPHNFSFSKKLLYTAIVSFNAFSLIMGSAMFESSAPVVEEIYHVGKTVGALGTSLFVFGFASGPIIWGPLSELFGRKIILTFSSFTFTCFAFGSATSKDIQTLMITRFFCGFMGAAPLAASPAVLADIFGLRTRGKATSIFAMVLFGGPLLSPIISSFTIKNSHLGWRWPLYFVSIFAAAATFFDIFFLKETHHPIILVKKAETLRRRTGNWGIIAPHEEVSLNFNEIVQKNLTRPLMMLFTEPILFLVTLYNAFIYGILYLFLTVVPLIFEGRYHLEHGVAELPYLGLLIGAFIGGAICLVLDQRFLRIMDANNGKSVPEERLPLMMIGSFFFSAGLFWLCWAGDYAEKVHWIVPTLGGASAGIGLITIFIPCINYIVDCYLFFAASALAGNTFLRASFGAAFPLFARQLFVNLGIKWAGTLLGAFSILLIPVPFVFYKYGESLRQKSKYAFVFQ